MGKVRDYIEGKRAERNIKDMYYSLNIERFHLMLVASMMNFDFENNPMGDIVITNVPLGDNKKKSAVLDFSIDADGFEKKSRNIAAVQEFFKSEIARFLGKDQPYANFYDGFNDLMKAYYGERASDDNDWQLNNSKNLMRIALKKLQVLYNDRPDIHSISKALVVDTTMRCLEHYKDMPKGADYSRFLEYDIPVSRFNKCFKGISPMAMIMEIDLCDRFKRLQHPTKDKCEAEGWYIDDTFMGYENKEERQLYQYQYDTAVQYINMDQKIGVALQETYPENFWQNYRIRQFYKNN